MTIAIRDHKQRGIEGAGAWGRAGGNHGITPEQTSTMYVLTVA